MRRGGGWRGGSCSPCLQSSHNYCIVVILDVRSHTVSNVVGSKGQIVISKELREQLGVEPGWKSLQRVVGDHLEVYFVPPEHKRSLKGSLAAYSQVRIPPREAWA